jgi:hypothetical protein
MLVYEKNNKLNINFDNEISENPDLQISKENGKTEVLIDGQESGGGSGGVFPITFTQDDDNNVILSKTAGELDTAQNEGKILYVVNIGIANISAIAPAFGGGFTVNVLTWNGVAGTQIIKFTAESESDYPKEK